MLLDVTETPEETEGTGVSPKAGGFKGEFKGEFRNAQTNNEEPRGYNQITSIIAIWCTNRESNNCNYIDTFSDSSV